MQACGRDTISRLSVWLKFGIKFMITINFIEGQPLTGSSGQINYTRLGERKNNMYDHTLLIVATTAAGERAQLMRTFHIGEKYWSPLQPRVYSTLCLVFSLQSSLVGAVSIWSMMGTQSMVAASLWSSVVQVMYFGSPASLMTRNSHRVSPHKAEILEYCTNFSETEHALQCFSALLMIRNDRST